MRIEEAIKHCEEVTEKEEQFCVQDDISCRFQKSHAECAADHRQLAEWLTELKELREENKVLISECDRLIKEKGELLNKVSGGDVLRICRLEEQFEEAKRLLKAAVEDFKEINSDILTCKYCKWYSAETDECAYCPNDVPCERICGWEHEDEALKLIGGSE